MFDFSALKDLDWLLFITMVLIIVIGIGIIYSASYDSSNQRSTGYARKQLIWFLLGLPLFFLASCFEYRRLRGLAIPIYIIAVLLLLYIVIWGQLRQGARRWIEVGPLALQPSEFAKLAIIFLLALFLSHFRKMSGQLHYTVVPLLIVCIPVFLIFKQPDLGTALTLMPVLFGMLFVAKARTKYLLIVVFIGMAAIPALWLYMKPYQKKRVLEFLTPTQRQIASRFIRESEREKLKSLLDASGKLSYDEVLEKMKTGWNSEQSMIAVGSGGVFGSGWRSGIQTQREFLPSAHTDFVFAVLCEEWGFMGSLIVVTLYLLLIHICTRITCEAQDSFGCLMATGILVLIISHIVINVSMTIGLMPITGLPLPLISYGGSSIWVMMISLGLLESIHSRRHYFKGGRYSVQ